MPTRTWACHAGKIAELDPSASSSVSLGRRTLTTIGSGVFGVNDRGNPSSPPRGHRVPWSWWKWGQGAAGPVRRCQSRSATVSCQGICDMAAKRPGAASPFVMRYPIVRGRCGDLLVGGAVVGGHPARESAVGSRADSPRPGDVSRRRCAPRPARAARGGAATPPRRIGSKASRRIWRTVQEDPFGSSRATGGALAGSPSD
jgi:hypothetical protein